MTTTIASNDTARLWRARHLPQEPNGPSDCAPFAHNDVIGEDAGAACNHGSAGGVPEHLLCFPWKERR